MDTESRKKLTNDLFVDELALLGEGTKKTKKKGTISARVTPKDVILNGLSAIAVLVVVILCNLFITPEFHYEQLYSWNFGILILVNWACGILVMYFLRQSGINTAKMTDGYIKSEQEKQDAFAKIKDTAGAQERLNKMIEEDFASRRKNLELSIATLVKHLQPKDAAGKVVEWRIGAPLPKGTKRRVKKMRHELETMTPPVLSIVGLVTSEASYNIESLYDVRPSPERTTTLWFVKKGGGKIGWFAIAPIVLSIIAGGLAGGLTIGNIVSTVGIIGVMLFNAARQYTLAYASVARFGVDRNRQIVRIIEAITDGKKQDEKPAENS